ncbi:hypothetical protein C8J56DRAFT_900177 [Mycena floridula]|nr:hypothetical protein C8J56DRAFT_900177 [Mycena floridula]
MYHVIVYGEKSGIPHIRESELQVYQVYDAKYKACTQGSQCTMLQVPLEWGVVFVGSELFCGLPYPLLSSFALVSLANISCFYVGGFITCAPLLGMSKIVPTLMMESKTALRMGQGVDGLGTPLKRAITKAAWRLLINRAAALSMATY